MRFKLNDVLRYDRTQHHCREGMAVVEMSAGKLAAFDTFWMSDRHRLTDGELATATVEWNLSEGWQEVDRYFPWSDYAPEDRREITGQHGLQRTRYVRIGAKPSLDTQISNAREALDDAKRELDSAVSRYGDRVADLRLLIERSWRGETP